MVSPGVTDVRGTFQQDEGDTGLGQTCGERKAGRTSADNNGIRRESAHGLQYDADSCASKVVPGLELEVDWGVDCQETRKEENEYGSRWNGSGLLTFMLETWKNAGLLVGRKYFGAVHSRWVNTAW